MPDTFSHIALPFILKARIRYQVFFISLLIGTVLPDYFREFFSLILSMEYYGFVIQFHSLISGIAVSLLIASLFVKHQRIIVFTGLYAGYVLHLSFDLLQGYPCNKQIYILLPCQYSLNLGIIAEADWIYVFICSMSLFLLYLIWQGVSFVRNR